MVFTTLDPSLTPTTQVNILDNGGMEIWQRGVSFSNPANSVYTADRWNVQSNNSVTSTVSQSSSIVDSGNYSFELNITATTATYYLFFQEIENFQAYRGKTLTLSMRVYSNAPIRVAIFPGSGNETLSSPHPGNNTWQTLSVTVAIPSNAASIWAGFGWDSTVAGASPSVSTSYIDSGMLVVGPNPASFVPLHPQIDLVRCQRYYFQINATNDSMISMMQCTSTTAAQGKSYFPCQMRTTPTITTT